MNFTSKDGKRLIAAVAVDGFAHQNVVRIDSNAITTVHGRNNAISKLLYDALQNESEGKTAVYWIDIKKAQELLQSAKRQLHRSLPHSGLIHSIREAASPVNLKMDHVTQSQQFKRWFGDWQKHPKHASKVVNADGTPRVVYHGTGTEFWEFDLQKSDSRFGEVSEGLFFFTNKKNSYADSAADYAAGAEADGGKARIAEAYLDINNHYASIVRDTPVAYSDTHAEEVYGKYLDGDYDGIIIENSNKAMDDSGSICDIRKI